MTKGGEKAMLKGEEFKKELKDATEETGKEVLKGGEALRKGMQFDKI